MKHIPNECETANVEHENNKTITNEIRELTIEILGYTESIKRNGYSTMSIGMSAEQITQYANDIVEKSKHYSY